MYRLCCGPSATCARSLGLRPATPAAGEVWPTDHARAALLGAKTVPFELTKSLKKRLYLGPAARYLLRGSKIDPGHFRRGFDRRILWCSRDQNVEMEHSSQQ
jgi:hypothetical protein